LNAFALELGMDEPRENYNNTSPSPTLVLSDHLPVANVDEEEDDEANVGYGINPCHFRNTI
jgi:hypothetical protein